MAKYSEMESWRDKWVEKLLLPWGHLQILSCLNFRFDGQPGQGDRNQRICSGGGILVEQLPKIIWNTKGLHPQIKSEPEVDQPSYCCVVYSSHRRSSSAYLRLWFGIRWLRKGKAPKHLRVANTISGERYIHTGSQYHGLPTFQKKHRRKPENQRKQQTKEQNGSIFRYWNH